MTEEPKADAAAAGEVPTEGVGAEGAPVEIAGDPVAASEPEKPAEELGEDGLPLPPPEPLPPKSNIPEETMADMKNLWDVFDTEKTNAVPMLNLGTILRALDIDVPEDQLEGLAK